MPHRFIVEPLAVTTNMHKLFDLLAGHFLDVRALHCCYQPRGHQQHASPVKNHTIIQALWSCVGPLSGDFFKCYPLVLKDKRAF
jgi:hypothetical protein